MSEEEIAFLVGTLSMYLVSISILIVKTRNIKLKEDAIYEVLDFFSASIVLMFVSLIFGAIIAGVFF